MKATKRHLLLVVMAVFVAGLAPALNSFSGVSADQQAGTAYCPPRAPQPTKADGDGDTVADDWKLDQFNQTDDQGNKLEVWCLDNTPAPPGEGFFFALKLVPASGPPPYWLGKCPFGGGDNELNKCNSPDLNGNDNPDRFVTQWTSKDEGADDDLDSKKDSVKFEYDYSKAANQQLTQTHLEDSVAQPGTPGVGPGAPSLTPLTPGLIGNQADINQPPGSEVESEFRELRCPVVGGVQDLPDVAGNTDSGGSSLPYVAIAGAAMGLIALGAGGWYARRRWLS